MTLSCIIVDDEPLSHEVLENYISKFPGLRLHANFFNAVDALAFIESHSPDLVFLDINMPELSGISMLKSLQNPPAIIFTTAYPQYAVDGFDLNITDFLLKPFSFDRFVKAVVKVNSEKSNSGDSSNEILNIKSGKKLYRISLPDILYLQSVGDYVKLYTSDKTHIVNEPLKYFEDTLPKNMFVRIHRSCIVALSKIDYIEGNLVFLGQAELPLGRQYKEKLLSVFGKSS